MTAEPKDRISEDELRKLRERLNRSDVRVDGASTVQDVSEAVGLDPDEVRRHLDAMRAAAAFDRPRPNNLPWVVLLGGVALFAGLYYLYKVQQPEPMQIQTTLPTLNSIGRKQPSYSVTIYPVSNPAAKPPPGSRIEMAGQRVHNSADGDFEAKVISYRDSVEGLTRSIVEVGKAVVANDHGDAPKTVLFMNGHAQDPIPGKLFYDIHSWARPAAGFIDLPIDERFERRAREIAQSVFADVAKDQEKALAVNVRPGFGPATSPPPGLSVDLDGRRSTHAEGPKLAFAPLDPNRVVKRLALSIQDAMIRDLRPPEGGWTVPAKEEKRVVPAADRVTLAYGDRFLSFDVPTKGTTKDAIGLTAVKAIERALSPVASYVKELNARADRSLAEYNTKRGMSASEPRTQSEVTSFQGSVVGVR